MPIYGPTHTCFDDCAEIISSMDNVNAKKPIVVHGICTNPENGELFAHAWVECDDCALFIAVDEDKRERVLLSAPAHEFKMHLKAKDMTRYTLKKIKKMMRQNPEMTTGPWLAKYDRLTRNNKNANRFSYGDRHMAI